MLDIAKDLALGAWCNLNGWRTREKLVVIESDDWGSIRMPDPATAAALEKRGVPTDRSRFDQLDSLESAEDLEALFGVLEAHCGADGAPAVMTFNTAMGNPDFDAIKDDQFSRFHHESLFNTYDRYFGSDLKELWLSGINRAVIRPQFHCREHLNSILWLRDLRAGIPHTRIAFDHGYFGVRCGTSSANQKNYLAAFWAESVDDLDETGDILEDGLRMFGEVFGYRSSSFVPCNYIMPEELENRAKAHGVTTIQGQRGHAIPRPDIGGRLTTQRRYTGQKNAFGQVYTVRNVFLEPYMDVPRDWVNFAMRQIRQAFLLRRPAVIVTHRVNYTSGMSATHRDRSLNILNKLLQRIVMRWGDVRFISSDQLGDLMGSGAQ